MISCVFPITHSKGKINLLGQSQVEKAVGDVHAVFRRWAAGRSITILLCVNTAYSVELF